MQKTLPLPHPPVSRSKLLRGLSAFTRHRSDEWVWV